MIIIFCGIPGSGKSTIAKRLANELKKLGSFELFISDKVSQGVYKKISNFLKENLGKVDFILIDATFYKKKWRDMVYKIAKERKEKVFTIYIHCSLKTSIERNKERRPQIPEKAVHIIYHQIEKPKRSEFRAKRGSKTLPKAGSYISINTDKIRPERAILQILRKIKT